MGCDDITTAFKRLGEQRDVAAEVMAEEGIPGLLKFSVEHSWAMNADPKTVRRYELMTTLDSIEDRQLDPLTDDEVFDQAKVILGSAGVHEDSEGYRSYMAQMIDELKGMDRAIDTSVRRLVGSTALEEIEV